MANSKIDDISDEDFKSIILNSKNITTAGLKLGYKYRPGENTRDIILKRMKDLGINFNSSIKEDMPKSKYYKGICQNCKAQFFSHSKQKFCSLKCSAEFRHKDFIDKWKTGKITGLLSPNKFLLVSNHIRNYLLEKFDNKCAQCGFNKRHPVDNRSILEIHHIDGNCRNNSEDNLILLCPNCHALTDSYRGRNKTSERHNLHKRKKA